MNTSTRKAISKKLRFEVFKRDSFTCQYCGKSAPDVILNVDHIHPVSKGGKNDVMNLITSCAECNNGKRAISLDDNSVIQKQKAQLDELNSRREQLEMMLKWREAVSSIEDEQVKAFCREYSRCVPGWQLNDNGALIVRKLLRKHPYLYLVECLASASENIVIREGKATDSSSIGVLDLLEKIARFKMKPQDEQRLFYIRGIVRNRMYCDQEVCIRLLKEALHSGVHIEEIEDVAKHAKSWTDWRKWMETLIEEHNENG